MHNAIRLSLFTRLLSGQGKEIYVYTHTYYLYVSVQLYSLKTMCSHANTLISLQHHRVHSSFDSSNTDPSFYDTTLTYMPSTCGTETPRTCRLKLLRERAGET